MFVIYESDMIEQYLFSVNDSKTVQNMNSGQPFIFTIKIKIK